MISLFDSNEQSCCCTYDICCGRDVFYKSPLLYKFLTEVLGTERKKQYKSDSSCKYNKQEGRKAFIKRHEIVVLLYSWVSG